MSVTYFCDRRRRDDPVEVVSNIDDGVTWFVQSMKLRGAAVPSEDDVRRVLELGRKELRV